MTIADFALPSHCRATALVDRTVDHELAIRFGKLAISSSDGRAVAAIDQAQQHEKRCGKAAA